MRSFRLKIVLVAVRVCLKLMDGVAGCVERGSHRSAGVTKVSDSPSTTSCQLQQAAAMISRTSVQHISNAIASVDPKNWTEYDWKKWGRLIGESIPRAPRFLKVVKREVCGDGVELAKKVVDASEHGDVEDLLNSFIRLCYVSEAAWMQ